MTADSWVWEWRYWAGCVGGKGERGRQRRRGGSGRGGGRQRRRRGAAGSGSGSGGGGGSGSGSGSGGGGGGGSGGGGEAAAPEAAGRRRRRGGGGAAAAEAVGRQRRRRGGGSGGGGGEAAVEVSSMDARRGSSNARTSRPDDQSDAIQALQDSHAEMKANMQTVVSNIQELKKTQELIAASVQAIANGANSAGGTGVVSSTEELPASSPEASGMNPHDVEAICVKYKEHQTESNFHEAITAVRSQYGEDFRGAPWHQDDCDPEEFRMSAFVAAEGWECNNHRSLAKTLDDHERHIVSMRAMSIHLSEFKDLKDMMGTSSSTIGPSGMKLYSPKTPDALVVLLADMCAKDNDLQNMKTVIEPLLRYTYQRSICDSIGLCAPSVYTLCWCIQNQKFMVDYEADDDASTINLKQAHEGAVRAGLIPQTHTLRLMVYSGRTRALLFPGQPPVVKIQDVGLVCVRGSESKDLSTDEANQLIVGNYISQDDSKFAYWMNKVECAVKYPDMTSHRPIDASMHTAPTSTPRDQLEGWTHVQTVTHGTLAIRPFDPRIFCTQKRNGEVKLCDAQTFLCVRRTSSDGGGGTDIDLVSGVGMVRVNIKDESADMYLIDVVNPKLRSSIQSHTKHLSDVRRDVWQCRWVRDENRATNPHGAAGTRVNAVQAAVQQPATVVPTASTEGRDDDSNSVQPAATVGKGSTLDTIPEPTTAPMNSSKVRAALLSKIQDLTDSGEYRSRTAVLKDWQTHTGLSERVTGRWLLDGNYRPTKDMDAKMHKLFSVVCDASSEQVSGGERGSSDGSGSDEEYNRDGNVDSEGNDDDDIVNDSVDDGVFDDDSGHGDDEERHSNLDEETRTRSPASASGRKRSRTSPSGESPASASARKRRGVKM